MKSSSNCLSTARNLTPPRGYSMEIHNVTDMLLQGMSHKYISNVYSHRFPSKKGLSERSVRRFCKKHSLHKLNGTDLDNIVKKSVEEVRIILHRTLYLVCNSLHNTCTIRFRQENA